MSKKGKVKTKAANKTVDVEDRIKVLNGLMPEADFGFLRSEADNWGEGLTEGKSNLGVKRVYEDGLMLGSSVHCLLFGEIVEVRQSNIAKHWAVRMRHAEFPEDVVMIVGEGKDRAVYTAWNWTPVPVRTLPNPTKWHEGWVK